MRCASRLHYELDKWFILPITWGRTLANIIPVSRLHAHFWATFERDIGWNRFLSDDDIFFPDDIRVAFSALEKTENVSISWNLPTDLFLTGYENEEDIMPPWTFIFAIQWSNDQPLVSRWVLKPEENLLLAFTSEGISALRDLCEAKTLGEYERALRYFDERYRRRRPAAASSS